MKNVYNIDVATITKELNITNPPGNFRGSDLVDTIITLRNEGWDVSLGAENSLEENTAIVYWNKKQLFLSVTKYNPAVYFFQLFMMKKNLAVRTGDMTETFEIITSLKEPDYVYDIQSKCYATLTVKPHGLNGLIYLTKEAIEETTKLKLRSIDLVKYNSFLISMNKDEMELLIDILSGTQAIKNFGAGRYSLNKQTTLHKFKIWGLIENTYDASGRFWRGTETAANLHTLYNTIK